MNYHFTTKRLIVKEGNSFEPQELSQPNLVDIVENLLEPDITKTFPIMWRGNYDKKRAKFWIDERDSESKTLLAVEKDTKKAIGFINFFREGDTSQGNFFRIGYVISKVKWGNGIATELVESFIDWCKENNISAVSAAVDPDNIASIRVLEKNSFLTKTKEKQGMYYIFIYDCLN